MSKKGFFSVFKKLWIFYIKVVKQPIYEVEESGCVFISSPSDAVKKWLSLNAVRHQRRNAHRHGLLN